jgi:hypothetical protein
MGLLRGKEG